MFLEPPLKNVPLVTIENTEPQLQVVHQSQDIREGHQLTIVKCQKQVLQNPHGQIKQVF